ncbi:MAG: hypothetical protein L6R36_004315 [Xanthoria steineri]|nr:MAG: hypothetical protein L6R36_004315 [Xanthoria steineri]
MKSRSQPFAIPAREGHLVFVTAEDQIKEVENSPIDQLSFHQAMEDRLKVKYTFAGFEMGPIDPHDAVPIRVLKTLLRSNIPSLRPQIQDAVEQAFETCMNDGRSASDGWKPINTYHFSEEISLRVNNKIIFGERLTENPDFFQATRGYHRQALFAMLTSHYFPHWTHKLLVPGLLALGGAMKKIENYLTVEVAQRLHDMQEGRKEIPSDGITWVIEASTTTDQRAVKRIVQQVISVFFASAHQLPVLLMFSIFRLCEHPEYTKPLIDEVETMLKLPATDHYKNLPLLESFLRETARHDPLDSLSVQRKVLKDFTFADGTFVPAGNVICVPQQAVMRDAQYYDQPDRFLPFRFADDPSVEKGAVQKFTDLKPHFYLWGATAKPCPGRWYASAVMQQFFVHLLTKYNFKLADPKAELTFSYTTIVSPRPGIEILLQER